MTVVAGSVVPAGIEGTISAISDSFVLYSFPRLLLSDSSRPSRSRSALDHIHQEHEHHQLAAKHQRREKNRWSEWNVVFAWFSQEVVSSVAVAKRAINESLNSAIQLSWFHP